MILLRLKIHGYDTRTFKSTPGPRGPVARERRLWPRLGFPAVPTLGLGPGSTGDPTSEQEGRGRRREARAS